MNQLPLFSFDLQISPYDAREDKIDIALRKWAIGPVNPGVFEENIREYLLIPPVASRSNCTGFFPYGWMFSRTSQRKVLQIRTNCVPGITSPLNRPLLLAGKCQLHHERNHDGNYLYDFALHLSLNPLRFLRYQPVPRPLSLAVEAWGAPSLVQPDWQPKTDGEFSLDSTDNWLPDTPAFHSLAGSHRWPLHLRRYIGGIGNAFHSELTRAAGALANVSHSQDFHFSKVEIAWEFRTNAPTELVVALGPMLSAYRATRFEAKDFKVGLIEGRELNSRSITIPLSFRINLRVYAKTNRRVRFEIIYSELNHRDLLNENSRSPGSLNPLRSWDSAVVLLSELRQQAANEMNSLFAFFRTVNRISHVSPLAFVVRLSSALQNSELAHTILSLLLENGIIARPESTSELAGALKALVKADLFRFDRARNGYDASPIYREPVAILRAFKPLHLLTTGRLRERTPLPHPPA